MILLTTEQFINTLSWGGGGGSVPHVNITSSVQLPSSKLLSSSPVVTVVPCGGYRSPVENQATRKHTVGSRIVPYEWGYNGSGNKWKHASDTRGHIPFQITTIASSSRRTTVGV